jgi:predicted transcriptional regulator
MIVSEIVKALNLTVVAGESGLNNEVTTGYSSDLLSDVMGNATEGAAWVTLQTHKNVMAVATLRDLACVILVKGLKADEDMLEKANEEGMPVLSTDMECFEIVGKLYALLN